MNTKAFRSLKGVTVVLLSIALASFLVMGCKEKTEPDRLVVKGTIKNLDQDRIIYLDAIEYGTVGNILDTAILNASSGKFELSATVSHEGIYRVRVEEAAFILLTNDRNDIQVNADWKDFGKYQTNSPSSQSIKNLLEGFEYRLVGIDSLRNILLAARDQGNDSVLLTLDSSFRNKVNDTEQFLVNYADTTKSAGVALYAIGILRNQAEPALLQPLMAGVMKRFGESNYEIKKVVDDYNMALKQQEERLSRDLTGKPAPDFTLPDPSGKNVSLSSLRGKYVLVDFWASWCKPCRAENPNVVGAYNKYKNKNFTVLGVSLDKDKASWEQAIKDDLLTWTHVSDLKFWQSAVVPLYNIEGIPYNVLLDPTGKVIASNLRGYNLEKKLAEVLK
jgi:peroxiredoxin